MDRDLADSLQRVARRLRRGSNEAVAPLGLTPQQSRALQLVATEAPLRPSDLAAHLGIAARSVTDVLDGLESSALITRSASPSDRRATLIEATADGQKMAGKIKALRRKQTQLFFENLSDEDRASLIRILGLLDE